MQEALLRWTARACGIVKFFSDGSSRLSSGTFGGGGGFDPTPVVTHRFPLERIDDAVRVIRDGQAGKVILEIST